VRAEPGPLPPGRLPSITALDAPSDEPFRLRSIATSVYLPSLLYGIGQGAVAPVIILSAVELGATAAVAFLVVAVAGLGVILGNLPAGQLVARIGERRSMHVAVLLAVIALLGCIAAPNVWIFTIAIASTGLSTAIWGLARHLYLTESVPYEQRSRAMSTLGGVHRIGVFIGPFLAAGVLTVMGTDGAYWIHIVAAFAASGVLLVVRDPTLAATTGTPDITTRGTIRMIREQLPVLRTLGFGALLVNSTRAARQSVIPLWALYNGLDPATASLLFGLSGAADMILFYPAGMAMDRWGRRWISAAAMIILAASFFVLPLATDARSIAAVAVLMGIGNGLTSGLVLTIAADAAPADQRGQFLGAFRLWSDSGTLVGPLLVSAVAATIALVPAIIVTGGVGLLAAAAMLRWVPRMRTRSTSPPIRPG
jgi:MFS family permease